MRDRVPATASWLPTRGLSALFALSALSLAACTSQAAAPSAPAAVTPTVTAQFVSPSAAPGSASPVSESVAPPASPSPVAPTSAEPTPPSTPEASIPPSSTPLGSVLPEVVNPTDPQEIADRQAVEAAWIRFWDYWPTFEENSAQERQGLAESIAVDPLKSQMLQGAANADANEETGYGTVTHRISWYQSVDGQQQIAIADCMDQSEMGTSERSTGKRLSKGYARTNLRGDLVRGDDGIWRVRNLFYLTDKPC